MSVQPEDTLLESGIEGIQRDESELALDGAVLSVGSAKDCAQTPALLSTVSELENTDLCDNTSTDSDTKDTVQLELQREPSGQGDDRDGDDNSDDDKPDSNIDSDDDFPRFDTDAPRGRITKPVAGPKPPRPKPKQPSQIASP
ncbi:hypothetical protein HYPSUDRAFT_45298 [Hypholoma sublateritium FD-334 SS-4]|uniref:Uncharacterized protein n=1 Tax=Hypholoma sublateritium (strain FD-334 SS-4) TaxID=945553 RepID=A0A0D2PDY9_HYPSF|nr:hypothetical protein HYPSUDRAFT_45298 [Hypholoma sublateritium FD-334 SS-4]